MKIFTRDVILKWEDFTIKERIKHALNSSANNKTPHEVDLVEDAADSFCNELNKNIFKKPTIILCGMGNNGADGLAIARLLDNQGWEVRNIYLLEEYQKNYSDSNTINQQKLQLPITFIKEDADIPQIPPDVIVLDALFGIGLNRPLMGIPAKLIERINNSNALVVSVDVPSGMPIDFPINANNQPIVNSTLTITFNTPKMAFFLPETGHYINEWKLADTKLSTNFFHQEEANYNTFDASDAKKIVKHISQWSTKWDRGHSLLITGSLGKIGSSILSSKACLRTGSGLLSILAPSCGYTALQTAVPEAMCSIPDKNDTFIKTLPTNIERYNAIAIGMGIGLHKKTANILREVLSKMIPVVVDADAINLIAEYQMYDFIHSKCILTPHLKEFERLFGTWKNDYDRLRIQIEKSMLYNCIIIFKGRHTCISTPEGKVFFNNSGNASLAKAGSGDVLSGMITALVAQGYSNYEASLLGVYLHGLSADLALSMQDMDSILASDIIDNIGKAFSVIK